MLEAISISKRHPAHGKEWLFREFSLYLASGEIVGLQGESGSGKSTLCRILAGMEGAEHGDVLLNGESRLKQTRRKGYQPVQLVFQHPEKAVNPRWRVNSILYEGWQPEPSLLEELHIEGSWLQRYPMELSGGQLQRICIARALSPNTQFLLADEMTTMLDAITQAQIWRTMLSIVEERKLGMLVVSHDQHLLSRICHRVVSL